MHIYIIYTYTDDIIHYCAQEMLCNYFLFWMTYVDPL